MTARQPASDAGRAAPRPSRFRRKDWQAVLRHVFANTGYHSVYLIAAGGAFFATLALFPAIGAVVAIYGLVADPDAIMAQVASLSDFLPPEAYGLVSDQVRQLVSGDQSTLSLASVGSILIALWSARAGVGALVDGVTLSYGERNERGILAYYALTLAMTVLMVFVVVCALLSIVVLPAVLAAMPLGRQVEWFATLIRWPVVLAAVMFGLGALYRYAPCRSAARVAWVSWGSAVAAALWLAGSLLFSWYVAHIADYNATYGSLGAIIGLMMWFYVSSYAVLLGAELNAGIEHHAQDAATGH